MKTKFPFFFFLVAMLGCASLSTAPAQDAPAEFGFPPGVDWNTATPDQIADAVFNAVKSNPNAAPDIAVAGLQSAAQTGRWARTADQDGKTNIDPDGSAGDPGIEDIASVISDAAKRANPSMAPQIDSAVAGAISSLPPGSSGGSGGGEGGGSGGGSGGGITAPPPIFGGGGGGSGTTTTSN